MEAAGFRLYVDLTQIISGIESRSLIYIDPEHDHTIADIKRRIKQLFTIEYDFALITGDHFLPVTENVHVLRDGNIVSVVKSPRPSDKSTGHKHKEENSATPDTCIFKSESNAIAKQSESKCSIGDKTDDIPKSSRNDRKNKEKPVLFATPNSDCDEYVEPKKKKKKYLLDDINSSEVLEENVSSTKKKKKKYRFDDTKSEVLEENVGNLAKKKKKKKEYLLDDINSEVLEENVSSTKKNNKKSLFDDTKSEVLEDNVDNSAKKKRKKKYLSDDIKSMDWEENVEHLVTKSKEEHSDIFTPKPKDIIDKGKVDMEIEFSNSKLECTSLVKDEIETLNNLFDLSEAENSINTRRQENIVNDGEVKRQIKSAVPSATLKSYSVDSNIATLDDFFDISQAEGIKQSKRETNIIDDSKIEKLAESDATLGINVSSKSSVVTLDNVYGNTSQEDGNTKRKRHRIRRRKKKSVNKNITNKCDVEQNSSRGLFSVSTSPVFSDTAPSKHLRFPYDNTVIELQSSIASSELSTHSDNESLGLESSSSQKVARRIEKKVTWDDNPTVSNRSPCVTESKGSILHVSTDKVSSPKWSVDDLVERTDSKRHHSTPLVFETKKTQFVATNGDNDISDLKIPVIDFTNPSLDLASLDPNTYPHLQGTPRRNDFLAFKILRMGHDYTPQLSEFVTAKVCKFCPLTSEVHLEVIDSLDQLEEPKGRFHLMDDTEENSNLNSKSANIQLNWNEMLESRLLYP